MTTPPAERLGTIRERVEAGAALLDLRRPGWWREIDLGKLSVRHECRCVLGQLYGSYYRAPITLEESITCGFDVSGATTEDREQLLSEGEEMDAEFEALTQAWADLILDLREGAQPA